MMNSTVDSTKVLICQSSTCRKQRSPKVLAAFAKLAPAEVTVTGCGCLGQCGNGPMVLVLPASTWYSQVQPDEVPVIVERHLHCGLPVQAMLYRKFHR
jgi:(2Fe-2S) ferredoxin